MIVRFGCWLVLLAVYCVALADLEVITDETEFDINSFVDNAPFQFECDCGSKSIKCEFKESRKVCTCKDGYISVGADSICMQKCNNTNPCQNGGTCTENICSCLNGTSGHLCKTIRDCSSRCGYAHCFYNVTSRDIYCSCDSGYAFDDYSKICKACDCGKHTKSCSYVGGKKKCTCDDLYADKRGTCSNCNCNGKYGCEFDVRGLKTCKCPKGYAQLNDECRKCDCGEHGNCTPYELGQICRCEKGYANKNEYCEECDCGGNGTCRFYAGNKKCYCKIGFAVNNGGKCQECDCGSFSRCRFDLSGHKECTCNDGYAFKSEICTECDCGSESLKCEFKESKKVCTCRDGYIPVGPDKICTQKCNNTNPCQNGGTCSQNVCSCLNGTSGHLCKTIDDCRSRCGNANCFYNVTSRDIYCTCNRGYVFDEYSKMCKACDCGSYARSCSFVGGKKKCTCYDLYADQLGTCSQCICKGYASMYGCEFDGSGWIKCNCLKGYAQLSDECLKCDCGEHGNCTLYSKWRKSCRCEKGYDENSGTCEECDCGENGTCIFDDGNKQCICKRGFAENNIGKCQECDCGEFSRCRFDIFGRKECTCMDGYALKSKVCTPCNCYPGTSCLFKNYYEKECICPQGYANFIGQCKECDCEMPDSNCTMEGGLKKCQCPKGFEPTNSFMNPVCIDKDECLRSEDNDCPPFSTKCVNTKGSYDCACKEGFEIIKKYGGDYNIKRDGCKDIDECLDNSPCIYAHTRCVNTVGSYSCECTAGYSVEKDSLGEKYTYCSEGARPWRTASIVVGCLFGFASLGLLIGICNKHCVI